MSEVTVISICELNLSDNWETSCQELREYCIKNKALYYAASKEEFSLLSAVNEAKERGFNTVVIEDLS